VSRVTSLPATRAPASAIERVTGFLVGGQFFSDEAAALEESRRIEFFTYCDVKFGKDAKRIASAVWGRYVLDRRAANLNEQQTP
jgi:hypothetical protein